MTLESKLSKIRDYAKEKFPPENREYMAGEVAKLRESGILDKMIKLGDKLPAFSLQNERDETVTSEQLLANSGIVLTVFRGHW